MPPPIRRLVFIKLKPAFINDETLTKIAAVTYDVLPGAHGVRGLEVRRAADPRTQKSWQLCFVVDFDSIDDANAYGPDKVHRAYADDFLWPMCDTIHVHHFELMPRPTKP